MSGIPSAFAAAAKPASRRLALLKPLNAFYNLRPANRGRLLMNKSGLFEHRQVVVGRPSSREQLYDALLSNSQIRETLAEAIPEGLRRDTAIQFVEGTFGRYRFRGTPTNEWRKFLWGKDAATRGRPTFNRQALDLMLRYSPFCDPKSATTWLYIAGLGYQLYLYLYRATTEPPPIAPVEDPGDPPGPPPSAPASEETVEEGFAGSEEVVDAIEASYFDVSCTHDSCTESLQVPKMELDEVVDLSTSPPEWYCCATRRFQPCMVLDPGPTIIRIHVLVA